MPRQHGDQRDAPGPGERRSSCRQRNRSRGLLPGRDRCKKRRGPKGDGVRGRSSGPSREIASVKKELRSDTPAVNVAYMLLRSELSSLAEIVPALEGRGSRTSSSARWISFRKRASRANGSPRKRMRNTGSGNPGWMGWWRKANGRGCRSITAWPTPERKAAPARKTSERPWSSPRTGRFRPAYSRTSPPGVSHIVEGWDKIYVRLTFGNLSEDRLSSIWRNDGMPISAKSFRRTLNPRCLRCPKLAWA